MFQKFVFTNKYIHNVVTGWSNIILFWLITWMYVEIVDIYDGYATCIKLAIMWRFRILLTFYVQW